MTSETNKPAKKKHPILATLGVLLAFLIVILVSAIIFPAPILRYVFSRIEAETGIAITFDRAHFYLAEGSALAIEGLALRRENHHAANFDFRAENVQMPAMVPDDFRFPVLFIKGLRGTYEKTGEEKRAGNQKNPEQETPPIHAILLLDAEVNVIDRTPEKPFHAAVKLDRFTATNTQRRSILEPYTLAALGQIGSAGLAIQPDENHKHKIEIAQIPLNLLAPYAPVLEDIFDSGSMDIKIDDLTDERQKKMRISITLLPDCTIKPADEILAPAIQAALQTLDQTSLSGLNDLRGKIDRLKVFSENLRTEMDKAAQIVDVAIMFAPRDVREKYEKVRIEYDRTKSVYDSWNTLLHDLEQVKVNVVNDTFHRFIIAGKPIEIVLQEVEGNWQYDAYDVVVDLVEANYQEVIASQFQQRIREIRDAVERAGF